MVVEFAFEKGGVGALHSHPHVQSSYVAEGRFEVTIDGVTETIAAGGSFIVPSNLVHGVKALEDGRLVDTLHAAPRRLLVTSFGFRKLPGRSRSGSRAAAL